MRLQRSTKLLIEPPAVATGDIAFNLIVFFLVCASTAPDSGRKQNLPSSESKTQTQQKENINVSVTRTGASINGSTVMLEELKGRLKKLFAGKRQPEDRIVVVKSTPDTPYDHWIRVTGLIEEAGGTITLQIEDEQAVSVK